MIMQRRALLYGLIGIVLLVLLAGSSCGGQATRRRETQTLLPEIRPSAQPTTPAGLLTLFLSGDVMIGRGIDQILPHPGDPLLYEPYMKSARGYVELAERAHGPIPQPAAFSYIWGDALEEWERMAPDVKIVNLETSITTSDDAWPRKGIHYRVNPANVPVLTAAQIDFCALANNHVLDWGYTGLTETLETLQQAGIWYAGAGQSLQEAEAPAVIEIAGKGRVVIFSYGVVTSGIPLQWAASEDKPGVNLLLDLSDEAVQRVRERVAAVKQPGDIVVISIHWGGNWGYAIPRTQRLFAHRLIDEAGVDVVHGHSSHHVKGIEVYKDRLIIYGAGDFINDYEGIPGHEQFRGDLALMYFASVDPAAGRLVRLQMTPMQIRHFRLNRASRVDALWLEDVLNREGEPLGTSVEIDRHNVLALRWN